MTVDSATPPLVSVVVTTRNRKRLLEKALRSVLDQDFTDFEVIVVDDASTDGTPDLLQSIRAADNRIRVVRRDVSLGHVSYPRNDGIRASHGELVALLDDDDEWLPGKLSAQVALMTANPDAVLCHCNLTIISDDPSMDGGLWFRRPPNPGGGTVEDLAANPLLPLPSGAVLRRGALVDSDLFPEPPPGHGFFPEDWLFFAKLSERSPILYVDLPLARYRRHRESSTGDSIRTHIGVLKAEEEYFTSRGLTPSAKRRLCDNHLWAARILVPSKIADSASHVASAFGLDPWRVVMAVFRLPFKGIWRRFFPAQSS